VQNLSLKLSSDGSVDRAASSLVPSIPIEFASGAGSIGGGGGGGGAGRCRANRGSVDMMCGNLQLQEALGEEVSEAGGHATGHTSHSEASE